MEYAKTNGYVVPPALVFQDEGYSGASLQPGVERQIAARTEVPYQEPSSEAPVPRRRHARVDRIRAAGGRRGPEIKNLGKIASTPFRTHCPRTGLYDFEVPIFPTS